MGKTWERTRRDINKFIRECELGRPYYILRECAQPWGDELVWDSYVFTKRSWIDGTPMCGSMSARQLFTYGSDVFEDKPRGVPPMSPNLEPGGKMYEPYGGGKRAHNRSLEDDAYPEIARAERKLDEARDRQTREEKKKANRGWW